MANYVVTSYTCIEMAKYTMPKSGIAFIIKVKPFERDKYK